MRGLTRVWEAIHAIAWRERKLDQDEKEKRLWETPGIMNW